MRRRVAGFLSLTALCCLGVELSVRSTRGIGTVTNSAFRSTADFLSLQALLADKQLLADLERFDSTMTFSRLVTSSATVRKGETCTGPEGAVGPSAKTRHELQFVEPNGSTSRVYAVDYLTCRRGPNEYGIEIERQGFKTDPDRNSAAPVPGKSDFRVFVGAMRDAGVVQVLTEHLRSDPVSYCRVVYVGEDPVAPGILKYRLVAGTPAMEGGPVQPWEVQFDATYVVVSGDMTFTLAPPWGP